MSGSDFQRVLVLGGAGFLGSHIARRFSAAGGSVTVIDGLLPRTGGRPEHVERQDPPVEFIRQPVNEVRELGDLIARSDAVIDCMAWTCHRLAGNLPLYDMSLNLESHLHMLCKVPDDFRGRVVYLGSRSQYGRPGVPMVDERTPMIPTDVQGIHKLAGESLFRVYAAERNLAVRSLRLPNCFGENQLYEGEDIGLVGSFVRILLLHKDVEVYGERRRRTIAYAPDVAELAFRVANLPGRGFDAYNVGGHDLEIRDLAGMLAEIVGRGRVITRPLPAEVARTDFGDTLFSDDKILSAVDGVEPTNLAIALRTTVEYFARVMSVAWEAD